MGARRHLPLRPHQEPRRDLLDRHAAADGERVAAHGVGVRLRAGRHHRPLPPHARAGSLLSDGLGRQRPRHRAPRPELLRSPLRPIPPLRPGVRAATRTAQGGDRHLEAQLRRALRAARAGGREGVRADLAPPRSLGRLDPALHDDRGPLPPRVPAGVPPQPGPRRGLPIGGAHALGRRLPDRRRPGRARGPRVAGRVPPRAVRRHRDRHDAPGADPRVRRAGRASRRRALHIALRYRCAHAAVRCRGAGGGPPARRAREGHRHRHDLHVRRRHRRHVVARAAAARALDRRTRRPHPARAAAGRARRRRVAGTGREHSGQGPEDDRRAPARVGRAGRRPAARHPPGEVLRARRPAARDRHQPPVVHPQRRPRARAARAVPRRGARAALVPRAHGRPLRQLGAGAHRRLAHQSPALLRRAVPGVVPDRR